MRLSHPARRLAGMPWWGWALAGAAWCGTATAAAVVIGRVVRRADRQRYVPQLDDPIRRDLEREVAERFDREVLYGSGSGQPQGLAPLADDGLPSWDPEPPRDERYPLTGLFEAVARLSYATDETEARYWLAQLARRGATWEQQQQAWDEWTRLHDGTVHYLFTDNRPEDTP